MFSKFKKKLKKTDQVDSQRMNQEKAPKKVFRSENHRKDLLLNYNRIIEFHQTEGVKIVDTQWGTTYLSEHRRAYHTLLASFPKEAQPEDIIRLVKESFIGAFAWAQTHKTQQKTILEVVTATQKLLDEGIVQEIDSPEQFEQAGVKYLLDTTPALKKIEQDKLNEKNIGGIICTLQTSAQFSRFNQVKSPTALGFENITGQGFLIDYLLEDNVVSIDHIILYTGEVETDENQVVTDDDFIAFYTESLDQQTQEESHTVYDLQSEDKDPFDENDGAWTTLEYRVAFYLTNHTSQDIICKIPKGQIFENKWFDTPGQNLTIANDVTIKLAAEKMELIAIKAFCLNRELADPESTQGNITIYKTTGDFTDQVSCWKAVRKNNH